MNKINNDSLQISQLPIGVFDSGVGGLTVLSSLIKRFPKENFIYLGDTARLPYGTKSSTTLKQYVELNIRFLLRKKVKAIVVACNSASSVLDETIQSPVPILGVIKPSAKYAVEISKNKIIGIIATQTTVKQKIYEIEIQKISPNSQVTQLACPLFVPLVEEGWTNDPLTNLIIHRYLSFFKDKQIDSLILGCTHFPLLKDSIQKVVGSHVTLIESGEAMADNLNELFDQGEILLNNQGINGTKLFFSTDPGNQYDKWLEKILGTECRGAKFSYADF